MPRAHPVIPVFLGCVQEAVEDFRPQEVGKLVQSALGEESEGPLVVGDCIEDLVGGGGVVVNEALLVEGMDEGDRTERLVEVSSWGTLTWTDPGESSRTGWWGILVVSWYASAGSWAVMVGRAVMDKVAVGFQPRVC